MSFWLYLCVGLAIGAVPATLAAERFRPWWARRWWQLALALLITLFVLPFGLVLILLLIDSAWDAIADLWVLWSGDFRGLAGMALGRLTGSGAQAWRPRHAP